MKNCLAIPKTEIVNHADSIMKALRLNSAISENRTIPAPSALSPEKIRLVGSIRSIFRGRYVARIHKSPTFPTRS